MKKSLLVSWIGGNDLVLPKEKSLGPIASTLQAEAFDRVVLLYNYPEHQVTPYLKWLSDNFECPFEAFPVELSSPINFGEIYQAAANHLRRNVSTQDKLSILLSPGTPAMQAVWILLGKTQFPCSFYQSSIEQGVQEVEIPFEVSAEFIPTAHSLTGSQMNQLAIDAIPLDAAFDNIITRNPKLQTLKAQAQILAERDVPVLIYGETGTGKELFARAIHNASHRSRKPFVALNCGAIPIELVDSVLFGHKKGAFTGATSDKDGVFQQADGGTLFLDEFGELEHSVQVRLLRVLQEHRFVPVGGSHEREVNVRIITATHRNLLEDVAKGEFREDLFYRVAIGVLHLPPLREREGDLLLLADALLEILAKKDASLGHKKISPEGKNIILKHAWRGNVRELQSTLLRAALWSVGDTISRADIQQALFSMPEKEIGILDRDISQGIDIQDVLGEVATTFIIKALEQTGHKKTQAAQLLGLKNYQTLNNWMEKYGIS